MIELRDYQSEMIDNIISRLKEGYKKILVVIPTGGGKTVVASELVRRSYAKGKSSIFMCHRKELLDQTFNTYKKNGITPAFIKSGIEPDTTNRMQIASVNTLVKRLEQYKRPDILFVDEAAHAAAGQWKQIIKWAEGSIIIGLTATPSRLDGKPLCDMFDTMIIGPTTSELITRGHLSKYKYYAPSIINTRELKSAYGDYTKKSVEEASFASQIVGDNISQYKKLADGKRNVVFAVSCKHGHSVCERYKDAGVACEYLDGQTPDKERGAIVERFKTGETKVLVNVDLFGEGFDLPAIEVVSLLRPTQSTSLYLQQVGRALRTSPGKEHAIILDHVNNFQTHGMPDDHREWSLTQDFKTVNKNNEESTVKIKRCPMCFFAHTPSLACPVCGYRYVADGKTIKEVAGELVLVDSEEYNLLKSKEVREANTLDELVRIERDRGYKFGWAERQYEVKTGKKLRSSIDGLKKIASVRGFNPSWAWIQWNKVMRRG